MMRKYILITLGFISIFLGILGALLPILPTAPFIILAAFFFSKGSPKIHDWLMARPYLGPMVKQWREHGCISLRAKIMATILMMGTVVSTSILLRDKWWFVAIIVLIIISVLSFIWRTPHQPKVKRSIGDVTVE